MTYQMNASTRVVILTLAISVLLMSPSVYAEHHDLIMACGISQESDRIIITGVPDPDTGERFYTDPNHPHEDPKLRPGNHWHKAPNRIMRAVCAVYNEHRMFLRLCGSLAPAFSEAVSACGIAYLEPPVQTCRDFVMTTIGTLEVICPNPRNSN